MDEQRPAVRGRSGTFAALDFPNYRLWFFGQMTSLFGTWMQSTAQGYLVYELTRSEAYLGYVGFASGIAAWVFLLYGGAIADRVPRRSLLVVTQTLEHAPGLYPGRPHLLPRGRPVAHHRACVLPRSRERLRRAGAPVLRSGDGGSPGSHQRDRPELHDVQHGDGGRPFHRRARLRVLRSRLVLRDQRAFLRRGDRGPPRHAAFALAARPAHGRARSRRSAPGCAPWPPTGGSSRSCACWAR